MGYIGKKLREAAKSDADVVEVDLYVMAVLVEYVDDWTVMMTGKITPFHRSILMLLLAEVIAEDGL